MGQGRDEAPGGEAERGPEVETAEVVSARVQEGAEGAIYYVQELMRLDIWGNDPPPIDDFTRPMHLSVLDVSGVGSKAAELVAQQVLARVWGRAKRRQLDHPVFIVLEEAHNFVSAPGRGGPGRQRCAGLIRTIASEGRKFGLFLVLISQRPQKLDSDVLSQCVSKIVMRVVNPRDQTAIQEASEALSVDLLADLPGLNRGEAVVMGPIVRAPALVRVGGRQSQDGGADIDVWEKLEAARASRQVRGQVEARRAAEAAAGLPVEDPYA
jgi:DNA helicase HerA-like ATPase